MSERLDERLRRAARTYRRLGNHTSEGMFLEAADTICELQTDNAKLRERIDATHMSRLLTENENEKLRELCGFMLRCMKRNHDCDCCLVNGEHCEISYIESDARELGVEVDA